MAPHWDQAHAIEVEPSILLSSPVAGAVFTHLPSEATKASSYQQWSKEFLRWVGRSHPLVLYHSKRLKITSRMNESEGEFRARIAQMIREKRDLEVERLRRRYAGRFTTIRDRLFRAEQAIDREQEQAKAKKMETAISFGSAILGGLLGRKAVSATSATRMGTAMKSASRLGKERMDVARAHERKGVIAQQLQELEARVQDEIAHIEASYDPALEELDEIMITPRSTDVTLRMFGLLWVPYRKDATGHLSPDWRLREGDVGAESS